MPVIGENVNCQICCFLHWKQKAKFVSLCGPQHFWKIISSPPTAKDIF